MASMEELARLVRELEDQLAVCMRCGMCQSVCALFEQTEREADVARGKLALLSGLKDAMFADPQGVSDRINKCLLCGSCSSNCPSGVNVQEIFLKARAILTGFIGLPPAKRLVLRGMLANPAIFDRLLDWGARLQKIFTRPVNDILGTSCARVLSPLINDRHFVSLAAVPFHKQVPSIDRPAGRSGIKVAIFTGCLLDKIFPNVTHSMIRVLDHLGVGIYLPENQGCCGIPALSSGDLQTFRKLVHHHLTLFEQGEFDYLVTACGSCTATIHELWPKFCDDQDRERSRRLARKTMDINRFVVQKAGLKTLERGQADHTVTYHDPCHLKKSLGVHAEPRAVIEAIPGYRLKEMKRPDWCCGMGGSFNLYHYEISKGIGKKKAAQILNTAADIVATGCPACMMQISDILSQEGASIRVCHPIELYAKALEE